MSQMGLVISHVDHNYWFVCDSQPAVAEEVKGGFRGHPEPRQRVATLCNLAWMAVIWHHRGHLEPGQRGATCAISLEWHS